MRNLLMCLRSIAVLIVIGMFLILYSTRSSFYKSSISSRSFQGTQYASLSCWCDRGRLGHCFLLPVAALFWDRLGYRTIATIIIGDECQVLQTIERSIVNLGGIVRYLNSSRNETALSLSTLARMFAMIDQNDIMDSDRLITSDADLFPINKPFYEPLAVIRFVGKYSIKS